MEKTSFKLSGLNCEACVKLAKMALSEIEGVQEVEVDLSGGAYIVADHKIEREEIEQALLETDAKLQGM